MHQTKEIVNGQERVTTFTDEDEANVRQNQEHGAEEAASVPSDIQPKGPVDSSGGNSDVGPSAILPGDINPGNSVTSDSTD
jgi:hypothetical protein